MKKFSILKGDRIVTYRFVTDARKIDPCQWERFVVEHPQGNIYQTPLMYSAFGSMNNSKPLLLACYKDDSLVGVLLAFLQKEYKGIVGKLSSRSIVWGGPLLAENCNELLEEMLNEYDALVRKEAIYSQFRNLSDAKGSIPFFTQAGFGYEEHLNILIDLKLSYEDLWKDVHGKRRNEIRRAGRENTKFSVHADEAALKEGYLILKEVYCYAKLPLPDLSLFQDILAHSKNNVGLKIFAANNNGKMIGVMFALLYKNRIYDWYAGAYRKFLSKYPNDLIPWEVICWGKANGFEVFDFGGAGKPGVTYGVRDYKMKFGGRLVNFGRFQKIHQPLAMKIARNGFKAWQFLKK